jgi:D-arabinose 1-dehydrogenase-like Zn-dependent alcohol dehydrogenase
MRAVVLESKGTPLLIKDIPEPTPNAGDAVLQVLSIPVLSYAKHFISGSLPYPTLLPLVPGITTSISY